MQKFGNLKINFKYGLILKFLICEALNKYGKIPDSALKNIKKKARFDEKRIDEIEKEVKHDVIAFLTNLLKILVMMQDLSIKE